MFHKILPKIIKTKLIAVLKVTVVGRVLLNGVVGQVHPIVCQGGCIGSVLCRAGSDVALAEEVAVHIMRNQDPDTNIELSSMDQERVLNILLDYKLRAPQHIRRARLLALALLASDTRLKFGCRLRITKEHLTLILRRPSIMHLVVPRGTHTKLLSFVLFVLIGVAAVLMEVPYFGLRGNEVLVGLFSDLEFPSKIILQHQLLALFQRVDHVNAHAAIQARRLQYPQILVLQLLLGVGGARLLRRDRACIVTLGHD